MKYLAYGLMFLLGWLAGSSYAHRALVETVEQLMWRHGPGCGAPYGPWMDRLMCECVVMDGGLINCTGAKEL